LYSATSNQNAKGMVDIRWMALKGQARDQSFSALPWNENAKSWYHWPYYRDLERSLNRIPVVRNNYGGS